LPPSGGKPLPIDGAMKIMLEKQFEDLPEQFKKDLTFGKQMYSVQPSSRYPSGTSGRISVMEVLEIDKSIEDAILKNPTEPAILKIARQNGMLSMKEDAILKSFQGIVPFEEVNTL
jgi:type II secretory ATPase GspE/PulE/Tfp pilus assembly ATPase PilB-like protein